jgi:hypothetical protein
MSRLSTGRIGRSWRGGQRYPVAQEGEQPLLIPSWPGVSGVRLVLMNFGAADAVVGLEKEFDVEGRIVLARDRYLGWRPCEFTRLAGYAFGGYPSHGRQDRGEFFRGALRQVAVRENPSIPEALFESTAYAVDLPEVVARPPGAAGLGVTRLRHLVLLLWQSGLPNRRSR